jgi:hypothetical protein
MVTSLSKIVRLEKELEEARRELLREDGERFRILMREMDETDRERIVGGLTDRKERVLFGLEAPEETQRRGVSGKPGTAGGDLVCDVCEKRGLTPLGLKLHMARMHKMEKEKAKEEAA